MATLGHVEVERVVVNDMRRNSRNHFHNEGAVSLLNEIIFAKVCFHTFTPLILFLLTGDWFRILI